MSKHTPGPWTVKRESDRDGWKGIAIVAANCVVANIVMNLDDQEVANAHLIAAAPELLEALKEIARVHHCTGEQFKIHAQELASAAIAKAEGRS